MKPERELDMGIFYDGYAQGKAEMLERFLKFEKDCGPVSGSSWWRRLRKVHFPELSASGEEKGKGESQ